MPVVWVAALPLRTTARRWVSAGLALEAQSVFAAIKAAGHRVVLGMIHSKPERITTKLLAELHRITPYTSDLPPREIGLIQKIQRDARVHGNLARPRWPMIVLNLMVILDWLSNVRATHWQNDQGYNDYTVA
jgi:hypothetical protein